MKNRKKNLIGLAIFIVAMVAIFPLMMLIAQVLPRSVTPKMFANIEELDAVKIDGAVLTPLDSAEDTMLKGLSYLEYRGFSCEMGGHTATVFAYVFEDSATAKQYYKNVTGITTGQDATYVGSGGIGLFGYSASLVALSNEKILYVHSRNRACYREVTEALNACLTQEDFLKETTNPTN